MVGMQDDGGSQIRVDKQHTETKNSSWTDRNKTVKVFHCKRPQEEKHKRDPLPGRTEQQ